MLVRCQECGYENKDMYRFCGMCGASLREEPGEPAKSVPVVTAPPPAPSAVSEAPKRAVPPRPQVSKDLSYLFEDEEPTHGHGKMYLALALLAVSLLLLGWHWYRDRQPAASTAPTTASNNVVTPSPADTPQPTPAPAKPAPTPVEVAPEKPKENTSDTPPPQTEQQPPPTETPTEEAKTPPPAETTEKPAPAVETPKAETRKPSASVPATPALSGDDKLVADGEKYLYGNGVPENCDLAQKNIRTAANKSNARAQTLLGAMYATGHCISRDLPSAYRWFAKALHNDPGNSRIQSDLEMVWKQMTPGERQMATRSQ